MERPRNVDSELSWRVPYVVKGSDEQGLHASLLSSDDILRGVVEEEERRRWPLSDAGNERGSGSGFRTPRSLDKKIDVK